MKIQLLGICIITVIFCSCISTKVGSTNFLDDGLYAVTITTGGSTSDESLAKLAASSVGVNVPFAYGIAGRGSKTDLAQSLFWGVPVSENEVRIIISTNIDNDYLTSNELRKATGVVNFIIIRQ